MLTEARVVAERSDEVLFKQNVLKPELIIKYPIIINYLNWQFKTNNSLIMCHFGAFVNTSDKFQIDLGQVKKECKCLGERLVSFVTYVSK